MNSQTLKNEKRFRTQLFNADNKDDYKRNIEKALSYILEFLDKENFYSGIATTKLKEINKKLRINNEEKLSIDKALEQIKEGFIEHCISFQSKTYVAHLNCPVAIPALVGDLIASAINTAVETWDQSTSATLIEQDVISWISKKLKLPFTSDGVFTTGGSQSNLMALLIARNHYAYDKFGIKIKETGAMGITNKFRFFCSEKAHFSIKRSASILGLGYNSVIPINVNDNFEMCPKALEFAINTEKEKGNIPIAVVATSGTTDYGSFDPVIAISNIVKKHKMWLHVDGAYGGCYVLTETHRHLLETTQYADSVTIDFHKTLYQPVSSSAFLLADKDHFKYVSHYADYLNPEENRQEECPNLIEKSLQTTRRFDALKLWFTLKVIGEKKLGNFLETVHYLAKDTYKIMSVDPVFEMVHKPTLSTIVFRYIDNKDIDDKSHDIVNLGTKNKLFKDGMASIASTKLDGKVYLKFTFLNPEMSLQDVKFIIDMIKKQGKKEYEKQKPAQSLTKIFV